MSIEEEFSGDSPEQISKSERKRQVLALQAMGEQLVAMKETEIARIPLPDELVEAITTARRIKSREAMRRQLQYIGKLMRRIDTAPIRDALQERARGQRDMARRFHELENWRDRLIAEGQPAIDAFKGKFPNAERQKLRQLVAKAQKEKADNQPPASSRKLFRHLKELVEES